MVKLSAIVTALLLAGVASSPVRADETQASIAAPVGTPVLQVHGVGAQLYECKADAAGKLAWQFREPIAALIRSGKTIGRHFAGPSWELADGSLITGKVVAEAPGTSASDIPWLRLEVAERHGDGGLQDIVSVQRINTVGGSRTGACQEDGAITAEPYAADYIFWKP